MKKFLRIPVVVAGCALLSACGGGQEIDGSSRAAYDKSIHEIAMSLEKEEGKQFMKDIMLIYMNYVREANQDEQAMEGMEEKVLSMLDGMDADDVHDEAEEIRETVGDFVQGK